MGGGGVFKVQDDTDREVLSEEMAKQIHRTTAQLLLLCKQTKTGVETHVSFLITRVKYPGKDGWGKLRHNLLYLEGTLYMNQYLYIQSTGETLCDGWVGVLGYIVVPRSTAG